MIELTQEQKDHAALLAANMTIPWLVEQLALELYGANMSVEAAQLLIALGIKTR